LNAIRLDLSGSVKGGTKVKLTNPSIKTSPATSRKSPATRRSRRREELRLLFRERLRARRRARVFKFLVCRRTPSQFFEGPI
jgi:hypothetical protein